MLAKGILILRESVTVFCLVREGWVGFSLRTDFRPSFKCNFEGTEDVRLFHTFLSYKFWCPVIGSSR